MSLLSLVKKLLFPKKDISIADIFTLPAIDKPKLSIFSSKLGSRLLKPISSLRKSYQISARNKLYNIGFSNLESNALSKTGILSVRKNIYSMSNKVTSLTKFRVNKQLNRIGRSISKKEYKQIYDSINEYIKEGMRNSQRPIDEKYDY